MARAEPSQSSSLPRLTAGAMRWLAELAAKDPGVFYDPTYLEGRRWAPALEAHGYITTEPARHFHRFAKVTDAGREALAS